MYLPLHSLTKTLYCYVDNINLGNANLEQVKKYFASIFLRHLYIQKSIKIDDKTFIIKEEDGNSCYDSLLYMKRYIERTNSKGTEFLMNIDQASKNYSTQDPVCVIQFWDLEAPDLDSAQLYAFQKAKPLVDFLRWHQDDPAEIFGIVTADNEKVLFHVLPHCHSTRKTYIIEEVQKYSQYTQKLAQKDQKLALYISLYSDAIGEKNLDFRIVKLWSVLETMAFVFPIEKFKEKRVRMLLAKYQIGIKKIEEHDLITLVYQHRNSMVHEGTCNPKYVSDKYRKWMEITNPLICEIITELQSMVNFLIHRYLVTLEI